MSPRLGSRSLLPVLAVVGLCACGGSSYRRSYAAPSLATVMAALAARGEVARSFNHTSTMDFLSAGERVKTGVYVMGEKGQKVRFNALDPAGGTVLADLACDGSRYAFVDFQHNCQLSGPCSEDSIAALLRVRLSPDDFVLLALGQVPLIADAGGGRVTWDERRGAEIVDLVASDGRTQRLVLDGRSGATWDVVEATVRLADGAIDWKLTQSEFHLLTSADGRTLRVGKAMRFEQPGRKADLIVRWDEQTLDPVLAPQKFELSPPLGLSECGGPSRTAPPLTPVPKG